MTTAHDTHSKGSQDREQRVREASKALWKSIEALGRAIEDWRKAG